MHVSGQLRVHFGTLANDIFIVCFRHVSRESKTLRERGLCGIVARCGDGDGWRRERVRVGRTLRDDVGSGTERGDNEDACGWYVESQTHVLVAVADGVSGEAGGEIASRTAIDVTLRAYKESSASWGALKRLYRAAQQANIEIHDRALVVTELRRMATTLTAAVVEGGMVHAAQCGDSRPLSDPRRQ